MHSTASARRSSTRASSHEVTRVRVRRGRGGLGAADRVAPQRPETPGFGRRGPGASALPGRRRGGVRQAQGVDQEAALREGSPREGGGRGGRRGPGGRRCRGRGGGRRGGRRGARAGGGRGGRGRDGARRQQGGQGPPPFSPR